MACKITEFVLDCRDAERLAAFWCDILGWSVLGREESDGSIEIGPPGGDPFTIVLSPAPEPKTSKLRLHLDVSPTDRDQPAELERLLAAGARPADVGQTGEESWHVLQDPEGNEFCLLRTRVPS
ncbi:VOC family protein [Actinomadura flavalba]|uniref:VOC family protein n=1 Tax=Actinomadura flavalba TaxID=1120938 RepID=UPI00035E7283|nr:VOC family protein [Actinomadura flavalba]